MPKSGTITSPSGADPIIRALGDSAPVTGTLAGITRDALAAATLVKKAVINLATRHVTIVPIATDLAGDILGSDDLDLIGTITKDDPTKASSPMTRAGGAAGAQRDALDALLAAAKPSLSVESLANRIEDAVIDPDGAFDGKSALIVIDQDAETVAVYMGDTADVAAINVAGVEAEDAEFVQTLTLPGAAQFGE